jgi:large subunit ribosomal protein L28
LISFVGLFHGKDVRSGHRISFSKSAAKRQFRPNVHKKKFWSEGLNDWVTFKTTVAAMKAIDRFGGIDNYLLNLDEKFISDSNYLTKFRNLIAITLYHKGELAPKFAHYLELNMIPSADVQFETHMNRRERLIAAGFVRKEKSQEHLMVAGDTRFGTSVADADMVMQEALLKEYELQEKEEEEMAKEEAAKKAQELGGVPDAPTEESTDDKKGKDAGKKQQKKGDKKKK